MFFNKLKSSGGLVLLVVFIFLIAGCDSQAVSEVEGDRLSSSEIIEFEAKPEECFYWDFYLHLPEGLNLDEPTYLEAEVTNTYEDSRYETHKEDARQRVAHLILNGPKIVPAFPNFGNYPGLPYLTGDTFTTNEEEFYRIDLQFIEMIDYAADYVREEYGLELFNELIIYGASSSGDWAHHFTMIHPDRVTATSFGATSTGVMMPVKEWKGQELNFGYGINDFEELTGKPFDLDSYREVAKFFYVGEYEHVGGYHYFVEEPTDMIRDIIPRYEQIYDDLDINFQFAIYNATSHEAPRRPEISKDEKKFLEANAGDEYVEIDPYEYAGDDFDKEFEFYEEINIVDIFWAQDPDVPEDFQAAFELDGGGESEVVIVTEEGFEYMIQAKDFFVRSGFLFELEEVGGDNSVDINQQNLSLGLYLTVGDFQGYDELKGIYLEGITSGVDKKKDYRLKMKDEVADSYNFVNDEIILESID